MDDSSILNLTRERKQEEGRKEKKERKEKRKERRKGKKREKEKKGEKARKEKRKEKSSTSKPPFDDRIFKRYQLRTASRRSPGRSRAITISPCAGSRALLEI